jgi:hypothetical protein
MEFNNNEFYRTKYILYKNKYLKLKMQLGGHVTSEQLQFTIDRIGSTTDVMITDTQFNNPNVKFGHSGNHVAFVTFRDKYAPLCRFNLEYLNEEGRVFVEQYVSENTAFFIEQASNHLNNDFN